MVVCGILLPTPVLLRAVRFQFQSLGSPAGVPISPTHLAPRVSDYKSDHMVLMASILCLSHPDLNSALKPAQRLSISFLCPPLFPTPSCDPGLGRGEILFALI